MTEAPVASATETGSLELQGSAQVPDFTALWQQQQVKKYGEVPTQQQTEASPGTKELVDARIAAGEVQAAPAKDGSGKGKGQPGGGRRGKNTGSG